MDTMLSLREQAAAELRVWKEQRQAADEREAVEKKAQREAEAAATRAWKALSKAEKVEIERQQEAERLANLRSAFEQLIHEFADGRKLAITGEGEDLRARIEDLTFILDIEESLFSDDEDDEEMVGANLILVCAKCQGEFETSPIYLRAHIAEQLAIHEGKECYSCKAAQRKAEQLAKREAKKAAKKLLQSDD